MGADWRRLVDHCPRGHLYTEANTRLKDNGAGVSRQCRTCEREAQARRRAGDREALG